MHSNIDCVRIQIFTSILWIFSVAMDGWMDGYTQLTGAIRSNSSWGSERERVSEIECPGDQPLMHNARVLISFRMKLVCVKWTEQIDLGLYQQSASHRWHQCSLCCSLTGRGWYTHAGLCVLVHKLSRASWQHPFERPQVHGSLFYLQQIFYQNTEQYFNRLYLYFT